MNPVISIDKLQVRLRGHFQLSVADLQVNADETVAIIGPNGSGKTTLLSAIAGLTAADVRKGAMLGVDMQHWRQQHAPKQGIGVQLQNLRQHPGLRVGEIVRLHEAIYRHSSPELLDQLGISDLSRRRYGTLSQGQRRRVNLFLAMAHEPNFLVLDEPTADLDDRFRGVVRSLISEGARRRKSSVLFATHLVEDLLVADRIVWLRDGSIVAAGTLNELLERYLAPFKGVIDIRDPAAAEPHREVLATISGIVLSRTPKRFVLFGPEEMRERFHRYALRPEVEGYSYSPTKPADLLAFMSGTYG